MTIRVETLTAGKLSEIYTSKDFRNKVAGAHNCLDSRSLFKYKKTCSYPVEYIVSESQILKAKKLRDSQRLETMQKYKSEKYDNVLIMRAMGMDYNPKTVVGTDDRCTRNLRLSNVGNYRVRTNIKTEKGRFFVEFATDRFYNLYCDFSIYRSPSGDQYNYGDIERRITGLPFTKENILSIVNKAFDANFERFELEEYDLSYDEYESISVKQSR